MQFEGLCQVLLLLRDAFWWLCIELIRSSLHFPAHLALKTILHSVGWLLLSLTALSPGSLFSSGKLLLITDSISFCLQKLVKTQSSMNLCAKTPYSSQTTSVSPPEHLMKNLSQGVARASYSLKNDGPETKGNKRPSGQEPCQPGPKPDEEVSPRDESLLQSSQIYRQACGDEADPRSRCEVDPQVKGSTTCNDNNHSQTQCSVTGQVPRDMAGLRWSWEVSPRARVQIKGTVCTAVAELEISAPVTYLSYSVPRSMGRDTAGGSRQDLSLLVGSPSTLSTLTVKCLLWESSLKLLLTEDFSQ